MLLIRLVIVYKLMHKYGSHTKSLDMLHVMRYTFPKNQILLVLIIARKMDGEERNLMN